MFAAFAKHGTTSDGGRNQTRQETRVGQDRPLAHM